MDALVADTLAGTQDNLLLAAVRTHLLILDSLLTLRLVDVVPGLPSIRWRWLVGRRLVEVRERSAMR